MRDRNPELKRQRLLDAGLAQAKRCGYARITRDAVAKAANVGGGTLNQLFGTIDKLRDEVLREAVRRECLPVIAQGIAAGSSITNAAPTELKTKALASLT